MLPFADDRFSVATVVLSLLHLTSAAAQDAALRELARVLARVQHSPGSTPSTVLTSAGSPVTSRPRPMDPMTMVDRLEDAGFVDIRYDLWQFPRVIGRVPLA